MMENKCKRFLSLLLAFVMVLGMFPAGHVHAEAVVDGNTITMNVGETYTFDNVDGDYSNLTDEKGIVNVDANFEGQMTERVAALDTDGIDSGAKYILVNTRLWKALENTTSGNNRLFCRETVANAPVWIVTSKGGNSYTAQTEGGAYMFIKANQTGTTAEEQVLEITKVEGTDTFVLKQNGQYLCDFNNNNGGADYDIGGYSAYNDGGNKWLFYKVSDAQAYSYTLANNGEKVSALESGKQYVFEETTSNKLLSNQWNNKGGGGNGTGAFLKLNGTKDSFTSLNVWTVTSTDSNGIYRVTDANNLHLRVNNGRADVTNEVTDIRINVGSKCQIGQVRGNTTWYLNRWGGTYQNSAAVGGWSDVNDASSQWNIYEVTKTALGTSDVTIEAAEVGTTEITIGGTTYHIVVEAEVDPDIPEVCEHKNTVLKNAKPATLTEEGYTGDTWCTDCDTEISKGQTIAKLTVKNAQPMMDSWNSGIVSLDDCLYTLSGTEGAYSLSHGGNYYVRPGAYSTTGRPQQNEPFAGLTLQIVDGKLRISAGANHLHVHLAGTKHNENGTHPWWNKCDKYHADAGNGSHDFYLLKANENSTFAGVPGYEVVTTLENAVGGSYLIAFTNKTGEWFVMYPSTETVSLAKVVTDAVTHTHEYTEQITPATCTVDGTKTLTCTCGHVHKETIPAAHGTITHVDPKAANCTETGIVEHWRCESCGKTWSNEACAQVIENVTIPALGHCWDREDAGYCVTDYTCCKCWKATNPNFIKVYFDNTKTQWETVAAFFWVTNVGGWAEFQGEENGIYTFFVHKDAKTVEFKNGSSGAETITTREFEIVANETYIANLAKIYFQENNAWDEIHVECYDTDGDKLGTSVSKTPVDGKHVLYVDKDTDDIIAYFYHVDGSLGYEIFKDVEAGKTYFYPECTHSYDNACDTDCNVCGATRVVGDHVSDAEYVCVAGKCVHCGADVPAAAHTPANDDGDCTTAIKCTVCGQEATAAKSHAWAESGTYTEPTFEADGFTTYDCTNSGCTKTNVVTHEGSKLVAVAEANGVKYATLQEAVDSDNMVYLLADVELTERLDISGTVNLVLNSYTISGDVEGAYGMIYVKQNAMLTIEGAGSIIANKTHAIGNYGIVAVDGVEIVSNADDTYAGLYNFYYQADYYGYSMIFSGSVDSVFNCGNLNVYGGHVVYLDNSGKMYVGGGQIDKIYAQDGSDAPGLDGAGTITIADPANITVPEGFKLVEIYEGTYQVVAVTYVAEINGEKYATLAAAIAAAQEGDTILLVEDVTEEIQISDNAVVDLDLNGKTLNGCFKPFKGKLTVKNGSIVNTNSNYSAIEINAGELVLNNVNVTSARHAVRIDGAVTATIDGGEYKLNATKGTRHALNVSGAAVVTIKAGTFVGPKGTTMDSGSAVIAQTGAEVIIEGGSFSGGKLNTLGGAGTITVSGGTFDQNPTARLAEGYCAKAENGVYTVQAHNYKAAVTAPTCEDGGYTTYTCEFCGHNYKGNEVSALGHTFEREGGAWTKTCGDCGAPNENFVEVTYVAKIGEQGYATLTAAIAAANAGDTITFVADITENVTINKSVTIDGAGKTYTGQMQPTNKADVTIKNVNFDGKGFNGYAVETRGAYYVTIEDCTAVNYGYGFVQLASATVLTTVKNVTVSGVNYGVKIDYSEAVVLENVDITAKVAAVLNSNHGSKPITIKNSDLNILGTWTRNNTIKTTYTFEGANSIDNFITDAAIDNFKLAAGATLTAPQDITVTTDVENHEVVYENGTYKLAEKKVAVAMIGEQGYETLAAAITAAKTGDTITFVADITENVTINKSVTIDGAGKTYTGTMTGNNNLTITIENVNFVNGGFDKPNAQKGTKGTYTIKNCTFVDDGNFGYAVRIYGANKLVVEDCTVSGYKWSFLYVVKGTNTVSVKNVTVENCPDYAVYFASGVNNATFENLTVKNSNRGFLINNEANRSFTIKDCKMENVGTAIAHSKGTKAITCTAQGNNDFGTAVLSEYAKLVLTENATLTAPEGLNVTTNAGDGYKVIYEEGVYKVVYAPAAMIGTKGYATLGEAFAAAQNGDTIVVMKDIDLAKETPVLLDGSYNTYFMVEGKNVTIDMNGMTISGAYTDSGKMMVGVFSTDNGGHLTVTGNGTVNVTATAKVYSLFANYEDGCSITIENGAYTLDKASDSLLYSGCDKGITVNGGTFTLGNVGTGTNGKPWIINCLGGNDNATVVNGGTFNSDISHQFWANEVSIPADLALKNNGDGTWSFVEAVACAEEKAASTGATVRKVGYATLQEAIDAVANGKTVTLLKDIDLAKETTVLLDGSYNTYFKVEGKSVIIDLNGKTISGEYADTSKMLVGVFSTDNGGHLTVTGNGTVNVTSAEDATVYSLFANYEDGCSIVVKDGTYTLDKAHDSLLYSGSGNGENEGITVIDGTFTLGNVGSGTNGKPWIANVYGQNAGYVVFNGGTYNYDFVHQFWANEVFVPETRALKANGNGTWTIVDAEVYIVKRGTSTGSYDRKVGYPTFKDAVAAIAKGAPVTTIGLNKNITVKGQFIGHSYAQKVVIDLNGYTMSSTDKTLTVYRAGTEVIVKNGTVHGNTTGGTIQVTYGGKLTLGENVTIKSGGSATALKVDANATLIVDQDTTYVLGGKNDLVVADGAKVQISAGYFKKPVQQAWCAEGYVPTDKLENGYYSVMKDPSIGMEAKIGDTYFESLQAAIEAAQDGDVIVVVNDITVDTTAAVMNSGEYAAIYNVAEKAITIDLNGKKIEVTANAADLESYKSGILLGVFCVDNNGELTLTGNGTVTANAVDASLTSDDSHLYSLMVAYGAGSKLTVENGTYHANSVNSALVYSQYDEIVTINGGTYTLGNLGTDSNGSPWLFNAKGQNERNILVNGGTFAADIQHQYYPFEVQMVKELALSKGEDGMYTVVPAVAYVNEQEWSSAWYTNYVGYATVEEAMAASEGVKTVVSGKKTYTSEQENVYVLASELGDVVIPAEFTGSLVLDNCTVKSITNNSATAKIVVNGNVVVENDNGSAITGEIVNISGTGTLTAIANGEHAYGIGGDATKSITIENVRILDVKGGYVQPDFVYDTKYGKSEPEGGAAIGSGFDGAVITLTNVTIDNAQGGSKAAGIGARYHTGVVINITDCTIKNVEGGNASAGIGGSRVSSGRGESGTTINILNSTITAKGGQAGAGIGSGYDTHCQAGQPICTINIDGSTINAVGGKYAAGVGTGYHNAGLAGEIKNSTVNAASGEKFYKDTYTQAMDIGFGVVDPAREARENNSSITFNGKVIAIPAM